MRVRLLALLAALSIVPMFAQFTNRYPKVDGYGHHIYLEGYELPLVTIGPVDPAVSPDGRSIALASRGWLWLLDLETRRAGRITSSGGIDSRPAFSPDGRRLAFVRDDTRDTRLMELDLAMGLERILLDTPALDLDPVYEPGGASLVYSSAEAGDLDLWRMQIDSGHRLRLTEHPGLEVRPQVTPDGRGVLYVSKTRRGRDELRLLDTSGEQAERVLRTESIASQTRPALAPGGRTLAAAWPGIDGWRLWAMDLELPEFPVLLTRESGLPLTPAWSPDGKTVYYAEADRTQRFVLKAVAADGGSPETVEILEWVWSRPIGTLLIETRVAGRPGPAPARLSVTSYDGHPQLPAAGQPRFDSQNGRVYFYSEGVVQLEVPAGEIRVSAARGLSSPEQSAVVTVGFRAVRRVVLELSPLWEPRAEGWYSADHHFHLNYGGPYVLEPEDLLLPLAAEDLDVATPLAANLHQRRSDLEWMDWRHERPLVRFGQEVRSHFLGHLGLIGIETLFYPWYWGPGYPVHGADDRPNALALRQARRQGGVGSYVHPTSHREPFSEEGRSRIPLQLIPDAVLGDLDTLEIACLWSDELGTGRIWHALLNLGIPIAPSAGTDAFPDFYRSMALGTARVYVKLDGPLHWGAYLEGLRAGRSFVTTGPLLDFRVGGELAGGVVRAEGVETAWTLQLHSPTPVETVELLVNGSVVWSAPGPDAPGSRSFEGRVALPAGGWIAARAHGGPSVWPLMDSYPFAHTAPVWIGERGSVDPAAASSSAEDLLAALETAEARLREGYARRPAPQLTARLQEARRRLEEITGR